MSVLRHQQKAYQFEDRAMEGYAIAYHAYLARRDLPGPEPTFADFVEIRKLRGEIEGLLSEHIPSLDDSYVEPVVYPMGDEFGYRCNRKNAEDSASTTRSEVCGCCAPYLRKVHQLRAQRETHASEQCAVRMLQSSLGGQKFGRIAAISIPGEPHLQYVRVLILG